VGRQQRNDDVLDAVRRRVREELSASVQTTLDLEDSSLLDLDSLAGTVIDEIIATLRRGSIDEARIAHIARVHHRVGVGEELPSRIYEIIEWELLSAGRIEEGLLAVSHARALARAVRGLAEARLEARESLERAIVELENRFDDLVELDERDAIEEVCGLVQRVTRLPLVYWAEAEGSPERGFAPRVDIRAAAGPAKPYALSLALTTDEQLPAGQGPVGIALRTGRVTVSGIPPGAQYALWRRLTDAWDLGSALAVPVRISLHRTGVIALYRRRAAELPDDVEDIAAALGHELVRFFRARAMVRLERRRRALDAVRASVLESTEAMPRAFFAAITAGLVGAGVVGRAAFYEQAGRGDGHDVLRLVHVEAEEELRRELEVVEVVLDPARAAEAPLIAAALHRERVITAGVASNWAGFRLDRTASRLSHGQIVARYPVLVQGQVLGVLLVSVEDAQEEPLTEALFDQLGDVIAAAAARLERNQGLRTTEAIATLARSLLAASAAVVAAAVPEDVQEAVLRALADAGVLAGAWIGAVHAREGYFEVVRARGATVRQLASVPLSLATLEDIVVVDQTGTARGASGEACWSDPSWGEAIAACGCRCAVLAPVPGEAGARTKLVIGAGIARECVDELRLASVVGTGAQLLGLGMAEVGLRDRLERERARQQRFAQTDALTGLMNRSALEARLETLLEEGPVTLGFLDLDGFKDVNDSLGHARGDELLTAIGHGLARLAQPNVLVARLGGDEFAIVLVGSARHRLERIAERVSSLVRAIGRPWRITGSIGWASAPEDARTVSDLLVAADEALYAAKAAGKARWMRFGGEVAERVARRRLVREELERALEAGTATFASQPKVDARSGRVIGLELLLRWPEVATPDVIEEVRSLPELSRSLGRAAIATASGLSRRLGGCAVAVNISPVHFVMAEFLHDLDELVERGARLVVEITEDVALDDLELAASQVAAVRARGLEVSLDDFGTAASSLSALARLHVDEIKVDRSFVQRARQDPHTFSVLAALAMLEDTGDVRVIAEGVELDAELALWLRLGGSYVQGYFYSRPVELADAAALLSPARFAPVKAPRWRAEDLVVLSIALGGGGSGVFPADRLAALRSWLEGPGRTYRRSGAYQALDRALARVVRVDGTVLTALAVLAEHIDRVRRARRNSWGVASRPRAGGSAAP